MKPWKNDVAVLLIFFVRDDVFSQTFEAVRQARPRKLLLWQDGARSNRPDDIEGIERCRKIVENIDWDCEVHRNYQTRNWGCDPSTFLSHKWAFSIVDKCIILEDDCVASQSFFVYCKELLDRYENDTRINRICGMCNLENYESPYDYLFSSVGSGPGFGTWKRVADLWDDNYSFLNDKYDMNKFLSKFNTLDDRKYHKTCEEHSNEGKAHWETIYSYACQLNNQLVIIPTKNLIHNIGIGVDNSVHSNLTLELVLPQLRQLTYQPSYEIDFPLKHPRYVFEDVDYLNKRLHLMGRKSKLHAKIIKVKSIIWRMKHGAFVDIVKKALGKRIIKGL